MRTDDDPFDRTDDAPTPASRFVGKVSLSVRIPVVLRERVDAAARETLGGSRYGRPDVEGTVTKLLTEALDERDLARNLAAKRFALAAAKAKRDAKRKAPARTRTKRAAGRPRRRG